MLLDSARALKTELLGSLMLQTVPALDLRAYGLASESASNKELIAPPLKQFIALGISNVSNENYRLAIRVQRAPSPSPIDALVQEIAARARGEVDIRKVGEVFQLAATPPMTQRTRPIQIGCSVGGSQMTGTVGCFVKRFDQVCILSNNHVLADENNSRIGTPIVQPGNRDGGQLPSDTVAHLTDFVRLEATAANLMDCAIASLETGVPRDGLTLPGLGQLAGLRTAAVVDGIAVAKIGRTTGLTRGRVSAFEVDGILPQYRAGILAFNQQIEIESTAAGRFSDIGDSGALVVDEDNNAMGLLFAGSAYGGKNGTGLTYATRLQTVLHKLSVSLCLT